MPLEHSKTEEAFSRNVAELIRAGHERSQALAISYKIKRGEDVSDDIMDILTRPSQFENGPSKRTTDFNGWIEIKDNPISKVGVFPYLGRQIDPSLEPDKVYMVYRPEEELSDPECIESFKLIPWVDKHPKKLLGPESDGKMPAEKKGIEGVIGENVYFKDGYLRANLKLFSDNLSEKISDGEKELSCGYGCVYELSSGFFNSEHYDAIQRHIRGNHLASVPEGRMGHEVAVQDQLIFTFDAKDIKMAKEEEKSDGKKEMSLSEITATLEKIIPDVQKLMGFMSKLKPLEEEEHGKSLDDDKKAKDDDMCDDDKKAHDDEPDEPDEPDAKKKMAADDDDDDDKKKGMDAALSSMKAELEAMKKDGIKNLVSEISKRDALASKISDFVGAFDHAEMTLSEVAKYGAKKLALKCPEGQEMVALDAYFHNRKSPTEEVGYVADSFENGSKDELAEFFNTAA